MAVEKRCAQCGAYYTDKECEECLNNNELERQGWAHQQDQDTSWMARNISQEGRNMDVLLNSLRVLD